MNFRNYSEELLRRPRPTGGRIVVERIDSTQTLARRIIDEYAREGVLAPDIDIVAWCQLAGRGRLERRWSSPPGCGVYVTLVRTRQDEHWLELLPLRAGVALCRTLNGFLSGRCRLKWPNDLVVGKRKLGGVLIEARSTAAAGQPGQITATLGFGINHVQDPAGGDEAGITSLGRELTARGMPSLAELALALIESIDAEMARATHREKVVASFAELSSLEPGDPVCCRLEGRRLEGEFLGFDERGFLRLQDGDEERVITTGEVWPSGGA